MNTHNKLRGRMREMGITVEQMAKYIGIVASTLTAKLQGKVDFKAKEIRLIIDALKIAPEEVYSYFFEF